MRRVRALFVSVLVVVVAAACQGVPRSDFNAGAPLVVPTYVGYGGEAIRGADGSTFVLTVRPDDLEHVVRKVDVDGTVRSDYGTGGDALTDLDWVAGPVTGTALADGSLVLHGSSETSSGRLLIRLDPSGQPDLAYGDGGSVELDETYPDAAFCHLEDSGEVTCVDPDVHGLGFTRYDGQGDVIEEGSAPLDFSAFALPAPPGTVSTTVDGTPVGVHRSGPDLIAAFRVQTTFRNSVGLVTGWSRSDLAVVRIRDAAVDPTFGTGGYARVAGDRPAGGVASPTWFVSGPLGLDVSATGAVVFSSESVLGRLTPSGALDPGWGDGGLTPAALPDATPIQVQRFDARAAGAVTVAGVAPGEAAVVLRYGEDGSLDEAFSDDGLVVLPSTVTSQGEVWGLDVDRGTVTVAYAGAECVGLAQDTHVSLLYG